MVSLPQLPPDPWPILDSLDAGAVARAMGTALVDEEYLPWGKLRRKTPPEGLTPEQWWAVTKLRRLGQTRRLPLADVDGRPFGYTLPDVLLEGMDDITARASGHVEVPELVVNERTRDRYLISSLMEEAITSSQLEGAVTTQRVAKEMLRSGREPRNTSERMIANNYAAMQFIRRHVADDITPARVSRLHAILTEGTLENPDAAGRLQLPAEVRVGVWAATGEEPLHTPPPAEELPSRLAALCDFANGRSGQGWIHPILRAAVTHFMAGYDHYFVDGNGRIARALFYWVALKHGYWLLEFVAISRILREAPAQYARAYLHTETDDGDVTYFAVHQVGVIRRAIDDLHAYLARKVREVQSARAAIGDLGLNDREAAIVEGVLRGSARRFTAASHGASHDVVVATARTDLRHLEELGLLTMHVEGRQQVWQPIHGFGSRLEELSAHGDWP